MADNWIERVIEWRPCAIHLTHPRNIGFIRQRRRIYPATILREMGNSGNEIGNQEPRQEAQQLDIDGSDVFLNDQLPIFKRRLKLEHGVELSDYVKFLNGLVFFWPGNALGEPQTKNQTGERFAQKYKSMARLRVPFGDLVELNKGNPPLFSPYNSGGTLPNDPILRGPSIFEGHLDSVSRIVEIVFRHEVELPDTTEWRPAEATEWRNLII